MATSNIQYCTHRDIKDTFPKINEFDTKRPIYGWEKFGDLTLGGSSTDDLDNYFVWNTGLITQLYFDGTECTSLSKTQVGLLNDASFNINETTFTIDGSHGLAVGDIIKINNEYIIVTAVSTNSITCNRGLYNTTAEAHADDSIVYRIFDIDLYDTEDTATSMVSPLLYYYDSDLDLAILILDGEATGGANPSDHLLESGEDFATLITRVSKRASRMIDSKIGYRVTDTQIKDREGNYPDIIVRAASLQSVILLLTSEDPTNPIIEPFKEELNEIVEGINSGTIVILGNQRTMDAAKGIIREVSVNTNSDLRPVELTGHYNGSAYELLKVYVDSGEGGVLGTTKMTVKGKSSTTLKSETLVDSDVITGDYQTLGVSDMQIRWSGDNDAAITTASDEYEVELFGHSLDSSTPGQVGNIKMTRM